MGVICCDCNHYTQTGNTIEVCDSKYPVGPLPLRVPVLLNCNDHDDDHTCATE